MPISTYTVPSSRLVHETKVDFSYRSVNRTIHIVQYDKQLPIIAVTLYVSGKLYTLPANFDVSVKFGKRDKTFVYKPVLGCNADRTVVYFEMDEQMTFIHGFVSPILELRFIDGGNVQRAGSSPIAIEIERNPIQETDIESSNEYVDLNQAVTDARAAQSAAEQAEADAVEAAALAAQQVISAEIAKDAAQEAQVGAVAARDELAQKILDVDAINEKFQDVNADLALKLDKPVGTFDITRKPVNDITAKYENEIITGSKTKLKNILGKSAHLRNIYGPQDLRIEGLLLDAPPLVTNAGNPYINKTNYAGNGYTLSIVNSILNAEVNELETFKYIQYGVLPIVNTNKYYFATSLNVKYANQTQFRIAGQVTGAHLTSNLVPNTYTHISDILTATATGNQDIVIYHFTDTNYVLTDKIFMKYFYAFNISTLIENKQYSPLFNTTFDLMSDAQIKTQMDLWVQDGTLPNSIQAVDFNKRVRSVGKNLFDKSDIYEMDKQWTGSGTLITSAGYNAVLLRIKPSTSYRKASFETTNVFFDKDMNFISVSYNQAPTTPSNAVYLGTNLLSTNIETAMIEQGSVTTTYEPHVNSDLYINGDTKGYRLPNGVKDTIEFRNGKAYYVQRVKKYILQASDVSGVITVGTYVNRATVRLNKLIGISNQELTVTRSIYIPNYPKETSVAEQYFWDMADNNYAFGTSTDELRFFRDKTGFTTLESAQTALAGTVIYYQLASPIETEIEVTGDILKSPNVTYYIEDWDFTLNQPAAQQSVMSRIQSPLLTLDTSSRVTNIDKTGIVEVVGNIYKHWNSSVMLDLQQLVDEKQIPSATKVSYETWLEANTTLKVGDYFDEFKHDLKLRKYKSISENLLPRIPEMPDNIDIPVAELNGHTLREVFEDGNKYLVSMNASDYEPAVPSWGLLTNVDNQLKITRGSADNIYYGNKTTYNMSLTNGNQYYLATYMKSNVSTNLNISLRQNGAGVQDSNVLVGLISSIYSIKSRITTITNSLNAKVIQFQVTSANTSIEIYHKSIKVIDLTSCGIDNLTVQQMDYWFGVYDNLKNGTQMTLLKQQLPVKPSSKLNFGYNGTPTELRMEYLDRFDNVISSEVKTTFLGTAYKYGNFTVPATAVKVNAYIKPSELITGPFITNLKAFIKFDEVNGSALANPNKYMWTPYEEDVVTFDQTLRKYLKNLEQSVNINILENKDFNTSEFIGSNGSTGLILPQNGIICHVITNVQAYAGITPTMDPPLKPNRNYYIHYEIYPFRDHLSSIYLATGYYSGPTVQANKWNRITRLMNIGGTVLNQLFVLADNGVQVTGMSIGSITKYRNVYLIDTNELYEKGIISKIPVSNSEFEAMIIQDELDLESLNLIKRLDDNGVVLAEPVVTPVPVQDYDAIVYNYGMELFELESELIGDVTMSYYRDTATQVDTSISLIEDIMARLEALEALHNE